MDVDVVKKGRPSRADEPSKRMLCVRMTTGELDALRKAACDNRTTMAGVLREAVNEYVSDYGETFVFGGKRR